MRSALICLVLVLVGCGGQQTGNDAGVVADAGPDATVPGDDLEVWAPAAPPVGAPFAVTIVALAGARPSTTVTLLLAQGDAELARLPVRLHRGKGSASTRVPSSGAVRLWAEGSDGAASAVLEVVASERPVRRLEGVLSGQDLDWDASADVELAADVEVPLGATLSIADGTRVLAAERVSLLVSGALTARGALFSRAGAEPWGGVRVAEGGTLDLTDTWLVAGGGDDALAFGHSDSQPVLFAEAASLTMTGGGIVDSPGKAFGAQRAHVELSGTLVARCDTGGQLDESVLHASGAWFTELPDADGRLDDDDNDGIYLSGALLEQGVAVPSVIADSVFAVGEDDAIDHNGAVVQVERVWIQGFAHEGVAASTGGRVTVTDSVILDCEQGVEAGYGAPRVEVVHTLVAGCVNGLRFGDSYDWETSGHLDVTGSIATDNEHPVWNWVNALGGPLPDAITIACSMVDDPEWDGLSDNLSGQPIWDDDGCLREGSLGAGACEGLDVGPRCD